MDPYLQKVQSLFDFSLIGRNTNSINPINISGKIPEKFKIGLIVGASGSGKTLALSILNDYKRIEVDWNRDTSIIEQINPDPDIAISNLLSSGFSSVPQWFHKYDELSEGQKFRSYVSRCLDSSYIVIDEFTSKLDRLTARTLSYNLYKYIKNSSMTNIILASPFRDIIPYLRPDWVCEIATSDIILREYDQHCWSFEMIDDMKEITKDIDTYKLYLLRSNRETWGKYKSHHYLSSDILNNCEYWEAYTKCEGVPLAIGYIAVSPLPLKDFKAKREHRLVILPEAQGMGIGVALSEFIGNYYINNGYKYYCKTSHPTLGKYRNSHPEIWKPSTYNNKVAKCNQLSDRFFKKREMAKYGKETSSENEQEHESPGGNYTIFRSLSDNSDNSDIVQKNDNLSNFISPRHLENYFDNTPFSNSSISSISSISSSLTCSSSSSLTSSGSSSIFSSSSMSSSSSSLTSSPQSFSLDNSPRVNKKLYYCHEYFPQDKSVFSTINIRGKTDSIDKSKSSARTILKVIEPFKSYEIDPRVEWKPTTLMGVIKTENNRLIVKYQQNREIFKYEDYGNNPESAKSAANYFLERKNMEGGSPTLYHIKDEDVYLLISNIVLISTTLEEFEKIKSEKLFFRTDTSSKRIFFVDIIDGKRKRRYLDDIVEYKIITESYNSLKTEHCLIPIFTGIYRSTLLTGKFKNCLTT